MLMSLLQIPDSIYIGVTDALAASLWYKEKLGLRQVVAQPVMREIVFRWRFRAR